MTKYEVMEEMRTKASLARREEAFNVELARLLGDSEEESLARFYRDALKKNPLALTNEALQLA